MWLKAILVTLSLVGVVATSYPGHASAVTVPLDETTQVVTFVFKKDAFGNMRPIGTGFLVGVRCRIYEARAHTYFVTARHVLMTSEGDFRHRLYLRMNKKEGGLSEAKIYLTGKKAGLIYQHDDEAVDLVVIPLLPKKEIIEYKAIPDEMILSREEYLKGGVAIGDEAFFAGLFTNFYGTDKNYPIIRFGRVAMIPGETLKTDEGMAELVLVDMQSYGANSGSPVFFRAKKRQGREGGDILGGVMKGYFSNRQALSFIDTSRKPASLTNLGVAAIIPAYLLHDILFSDVLVGRRADRDAANPM